LPCLSCNHRKITPDFAGQAFYPRQLLQDMDIPALKAIALAETGEVEVLLREDQILRIAEEYANAGIHEVKREVIDQPGEALWNMIRLAELQQ